MSTVREIDEINILKATFLAMKRAFYSLKVKPHGIEPNTPARRNLAEACQLTSFNDNGEIPFPYHPRLYSYGCLRRRVEPDALLVDGNASIPDIDCFQKTIIKGDARSFSIAAASILAKVSRDSLICEYAKKYPQYEFEKHKGYGTRRHMELIKKIGPCPIHRKTFAPIKQMLEKKE
ncbi:MAG: ribonuclease HII [Candidatus Aureabacteria bacterium]|nr:ribonuclease HII [Candidatus Auribacterota bacterium]